MISGRVVFVTALALTLIGGVWASPITYSVDARSSYLLVEGGIHPDQVSDPLFIFLSALGLGAGDQVTIRGTGDAGYWGPGGQQLPAVFGGVFTVDDWLGPWNSLERLTAVGLAPPAGATALGEAPTFYSHTSTDIPQDFLIPGGDGVTVTIPEGANYLAIGIWDSYYRDNVGDLEVTLSWVPEPATYLLILAGLAGLAALRRRKA